MIQQIAKFFIACTWTGDGCQRSAIVELPLTHGDDMERQAKAELTPVGWTFPGTLAWCPTCTQNIRERGH